MSTEALHLPFDRKSQNEIILRELQAGEKLTPLKILKLCGSLRASGRIYDLKHGKYDGVEYPIEKRMVTVGTLKRVAEYYIERNSQ